jgi:hypothetical protein
MSDINDSNPFDLEKELNKNATLADSPGQNSAAKSTGKSFFGQLFSTKRGKMIGGIIGAFVAVVVVGVTIFGEGAMFKGMNIGNLGGSPNPGGSYSQQGATPATALDGLDLQQEDMELDVEAVPESNMPQEDGKCLDYHFYDESVNFCIYVGDLKNWTCEIATEIHGDPEKHKVTEATKEIVNAVVETCDCMNQPGYQMTQDGCVFSCNEYLAEKTFLTKLISAGYLMVPGSENKSPLKSILLKYYEAIMDNNCFEEANELKDNNNPELKEFIENLPNIYQDQYEEWTCPAFSEHPLSKEENIYTYFEHEDNYCEIIEENIPDLKCGFMYELYSNQEKYNLNTQQKEVGAIESNINVEDLGPEAKAAILTAIGYGDDEPDKVWGPVSEDLQEIMEFNPYSVDLVGILETSFAQGGCGCQSIYSEIEEFYSSYVESQNSEDLKNLTYSINAFSALEGDCPLGPEQQGIYAEAIEVALGEGECSLLLEDIENQFGTVQDKLNLNKSTFSEESLKSALEEFDGLLSQIGAMDDCPLALPAKVNYCEYFQSTAKLYLNNSQAPTIENMGLMESATGGMGCSISKQEMSNYEEDAQCSLKQFILQFDSVPGCAVNLATKSQSLSHYGLCLESIVTEIDSLTCVAEKAETKCAYINEITELLEKIEGFEFTETLKDKLEEQVELNNCCSNYEAQSQSVCEITGTADACMIEGLVAKSDTIAEGVNSGTYTTEQLKTELESLGQEIEAIGDSSSYQSEGGQNCSFGENEKQTICQDLMGAAYAHMNIDNENRDIQIMEAIESVKEVLGCSIVSSNLFADGYEEAECGFAKAISILASHSMCAMKTLLEPSNVCTNELIEEIDDSECVAEDDKQKSKCEGLMIINALVSNVEGYTMSEETKAIISAQASDSLCCSYYDTNEISYENYPWMCEVEQTPNCLEGEIEIIDVLGAVTCVDCTTLKSNLDALYTTYTGALTDETKVVALEALEAALVAEADNIAACEDINPETDYVIEVVEEPVNPCLDATAEDGTVVPGYESKFATLILAIEEFMAVIEDANQEVYTYEEAIQTWVDYQYEYKALYDEYQVYIAGGGTACEIDDEVDDSYLPYTCTGLKAKLDALQANVEKLMIGESLEAAIVLADLGYTPAVGAVLEDEYELYMQQLMDEYTYAQENHAAEVCALASYVMFLDGKNCTYFEAKQTEITGQMQALLNGLTEATEPEISYNTLQDDLNALFDTSTGSTSEYNNYLLVVNGEACDLTLYDEYKAKTYADNAVATCDENKAALAAAETQMNTAQTEAQFNLALAGLKAALEAASALPACTVDATYTSLATAMWDPCAEKYDSTFSFYKVNIENATSPITVATLQGQLSPLITAAKVEGCLVPAEIEVLLTYQAAAVNDCSVFDNEFTILTQLIQSAKTAAEMEAYKGTLQQKMTAAELAGCTTPIQLIGVLAAEFAPVAIAQTITPQPVMAPQPVQTVQQPIQVVQQPAPQQLQAMGMTYPQGMAAVYPGAIPYNGIPASTGPETAAYAAIFLSLVAAGFLLRKKHFSNK